MKKTIKECLIDIGIDASDMTLTEALDELSKKWSKLSWFKRRKIYRAFLGLDKEYSSQWK
jgi:hypothetical protein